MGNTWEIELYEYAGGRGRGWVQVDAFEGTPEEAIKRLVELQRDNSARCFRLVWRP